MKNYSVSVWSGCLLWKHPKTFTSRKVATVAGFEFAETRDEPTMMFVRRLSESGEEIGRETWGMIHGVWTLVSRNI